MNPKTGECCIGDFTPFRENPSCTVCGGNHFVTVSRFARRSENLDKSDIRPCGSCGQRPKPKLPEIQVRDLSEEEAAVFREWRASGHHELDCLRWIEGRRYDPAKDETFLAHARIEFKRWRFLREQNK